MATETMTMLMPEKRRLPKDANLPPENERYLRACSDIASALIQEHEAQQDPSKPKKDINLNSLRSKMSKKHRLNNTPPLTAIIAAIPEHYKKYILPRLIAKPIRIVPIPPCDNKFSNIDGRDFFRNCCGSCHVQTASVSAYSIYWQYLRLLSWWSRLRL
jgi:hypothetical protein